MGELEGKGQSHRIHDLEVQAHRAVFLEARQIWSLVLTSEYLWVTLRLRVKGRSKENRYLWNVSRQTCTDTHFDKSLPENR